MIGLEYNQQLVERANSQYGNTKFSFYQMDVDRDSFSADLQKLCAEPEDREFDLICLSFVLMHLHDGEKLLRTLKNFLKKGGVILSQKAMTAYPLWLQMKRIFLDSFWTS